MATERPSKERTVIRPSTELKRAMDEADKCMAFINENEFIDYFQSLNEAYLENRGNIKGPEVAIGTRLDDKQKESQKLETGSTYGGAGVGLEWEDILEGRKYKKAIGMTINYDSNSNLYIMLLHASEEKKWDSRGISGLLSTGREFQRNFYLNPELDLVKYVDNIILTFTNELFDSEIL